MEVDLSGLRRYELKYTIPESLARQIRDYIQPFCSLDPNASAAERGYTVNNIYLDTPGLRFYHDVQAKQETRLKPRVRYYGPAPDDHVILEVKHRHNTISWKRRRQIPADQWPGVLEIAPSQQETSSYTTMPETFAEVNHLYSTTPVLHVRYFREPYVSDIDPYGRVTFDRALRFRLAHGSYELAIRDEDMSYYDDPVNTRSDDSPVVLEIKTQAFVPSWAVDLIRHFSLMQRGYSKYCYAIDRCLEDGYSIAELSL
jgi:hypothetical protein